jgi:hypothetical protein
MGLFDFTCAKCGPSESGQERSDTNVIISCLSNDNKTYYFNGVYIGYGYIDVKENTTTHEIYAVEFEHHFIPDWKLKPTSLVCEEVWCEDCKYGFPTSILGVDVKSDVLETVDSFMNPQKQITIAKPAAQPVVIKKQPLSKLKKADLEVKITEAQTQIEELSKKASEYDTLLSKFNALRASYETVLEVSNEKDDQLKNIQKILYRNIPSKWE